MGHTNYKNFVSQVTPSVLSHVGIDTHAHLSLHYFGDDLNDVLTRAHESALCAILSICLNIEAYNDACMLYDVQDIEVYSAIAIHPCDVVRDIEGYKKQFSRLLKEDSRIKAIGETGLDYHWKDIPHEMQKASLLEHIALAKDYAKPLALHTRDAEQDVYDILCKENMTEHPVLWHCYGGSAELAQRIVDNGWYISFAGNITYPNAQMIREALHRVPTTQLLIETDCPYLAPQPVRGNRNEPSYLMYTAEVIAHELCVDVDTVWKWTSDNARRILDI